MKKGGRDLPNLHFSGHWARSKHLCQDCQRRKGRRGEPQNHQRIQSFPCCFTRTRRRFHPSELRLLLAEKLPHGSVSTTLSLLSSALLHLSLELSFSCLLFNRGMAAITTPDLRLARSPRTLPPWGRSQRACARCACSSSPSPSSRDAVCVMCPSPPSTLIRSSDCIWVLRTRIFGSSFKQPSCC